ncbi:pseudouridine synthase [Candidatus Vidania fulgoroideorum]
MINISNRNKYIKKYNFKFILKFKKKYLIIFKKKNINMIGEKSIFSSIYSLFGNKVFKLNRCGIISRIDKNTSGIIIYSLDNNFTIFFKKTKKCKTYLTVVFSKKKIGNFCINSGINIFGNKSIATKKYFNFSKTKIKIIDKVKDNKEYYYFLKCSIINGKRHQIRSHLKYKNILILGDKKYGKFNEICKESNLHSWRIKFILNKKKKKYYCLPSNENIYYYRKYKFKKLILI